MNTKMSQILLFSLVITSLLQFSHLQKAVPCDYTKCIKPNCRCASTSIPSNLSKDKVPQFVFLTFDDAVTALNHNQFYTKIFPGRKNPDGCPISGTFFVSHEYTDYSKVHELYLSGHEIALHSVTHTAFTTYWQNITKDQLRREFGNEKKYVSNFGKIPENSVKGMRLPFLQLSGNKSFEVLKELKLQYDCSWPSQRFLSPGLWPYTLDYLSNQDCPIGPCPDEAIPGIWVVPMTDWIDKKKIVCAMVDSCVNIPENVDGILQWFKDNFNRQYLKNKAPFGFYVHAAWFSVNSNHFDAYLKFVDYLQTLSDVYIVNIATGLQWIQNPVQLGSKDWNSCRKIEDYGCEPQQCHLKKNGVEDRYMTICNEDCPEEYPWINKSVY